MSSHAVSAVEGVALSPQQSRLWRLQEASQNGGLRTRFAISIQGPLDHARLESAWREVNQRHQILRTTFEYLPGIKDPLQVVQEEGSAIRRGETRVSLNGFFRTRLFADMEGKQAQGGSGEGIVTLYKVSEQHHILAFSLPALLADGETARIIFRELCRMYDSAEAPDDSETIQYAQFSEWYSELLAGEEIEESRDYWRRRGGNSPSEFPLSRKKDSAAFATSIESFSLAGQYAPLNKVAEVLGTTVPDVLLAAWLVVLHRFTGQSPVVAGALVDGRKYSELDSMPGLAGRYLPIACAISGEDAFRDVVARVVAEKNNVYQHQEGFSIPGDAAAEISRALPVAFEGYTLPSPHRIGETVFRLDAVMAEVDHAELVLCCNHDQDGVTLALRFDPAVFTPAYVGRITECYQTLVEFSVKHPESVVADLPLFDQHEFLGWVAQINDTKRPLANAAPVHDVIAQVAEKQWNEVAVEGENLAVTYGKIQTEADQLAQRLHGLGVGPESVVGIMMEHSPELVTAILGVLRSGAAYLPIDPTLPQQRIAYMLEDSHARLILTKESVAPLLPAVQSEIIVLKPDWHSAANQSSTNFSSKVLPENLAYLIYTSGSTGMPKASMITHRGLSNYIEWAIEAYAIAEGTGAALHSSIGFDLTVTSLFGPLMTGKKIVLASMESLSPCLRSHADFSLLKVTPAHARLLGMQLPAAEAAGKARYLILGGEALRPGDVAFWRENAPGTILVNEYGPTETVVGCCVYQVAGPLPEGEAVPIGSPIANTQLYLLDSHLRPVPIGVAGEIYVAGDGLARGYLGRPDLTAERFLPHPFSVEPGARIYRTGDLGRYLPDGTIDCLGRTDHQVKVRGYRVELGEVESVLAKLPAVGQACVISRSTDRGTQLVAYLVPPNESDQKTQASVSEVREHLSRFLPDYMVPAAYVWLKELPLTANGKVDRKALPSPDTAGAEAYTEPRTLEEELLSGIWSQVLSIQRVGIDDNYFALGGDSIRSLQIITRAAERGLNFTVGDIFRYQTIRTLAQNLETLKSSPEVKVGPFSLITPEDQRLLPADAEAAYPLTRLQAGMVFHRELHPESAVYHDIGTFHLRTPLREELVSKAIAEVVARHPALRTSFDLVTYSQPLQVVHRDAPVPLTVDDLTHLDSEAQEIALQEWAEGDKRRGFDVTQYPLVRFQVHKRSAESFQFTLCFHHAILDGWSDASMLTEIAQRYFQQLRNEPYAPLPPETQFRDFVLLELEAIASEEHRRFWQERLEESEFIRVPRWKPTPVTTKRGVGFYEVEISDELSNSLKRLALSAAVPVKTVLLAAHMRALAMLSGKTDVTTFLTSVGRPETRDGDRVLGLFLNSTPFRLNLSSGGKWSHLLEEAFAAEREAVPFRRFPLAEIQKLLGRDQLSETGFYFTHYHIYHGLEQFEDFQLLSHNYYEETNITLLANFALASFSNKVRFYLTCDQTEIGPEQLEAVANYYHRVLIEMADHPEGRYDTMSLLSEPEQAAALAAATENATQPQSYELFVEQFSRQAALVPQAVAVSDDRESLTYQQLEQRSNQMAHRLRALGVKAEVVVGLLLERSIELAVSVLGVLKAGGAYLPLDPAYPQERLAFILRDAKAGILVTQDNFKEQFANLPVNTLSMEVERESLSGYSPEPVENRLLPDTLAYVIYTSGSTGMPKGVMITHRSLASYLAWCVKTYLPKTGRGSLVHSSISFDLTVTAMLAPLVAGQPVKMVPDAGGLDALAEALVGSKDLSFVKLTPIHLRMLREQVPDEKLAGHTSSLIIGGEALRSEDVQRWQSAAPECVLINEYGPTEATVGCSVFRIPAGASSSKSGDVPIGKPITGASLYILDDFLQPAPLLTPGELYIGGACLARGYLARPELTAEKFIPDPFSNRPGERLYRTGDLARVLADGNLDFLGRRDSQLKIRGFRIEIGEIESALESHDDVAQAVVLARTFKNTDRKLVAYIVPAGPAIDVAALRSFLQRKLPEYMIPAIFVPLEKLPLTRNGKLDRSALPDPEAVRGEQVEFVAPRTAEEQILAGVWARVLNLERVGIDDDYFGLGGDSIRSIQIVSLSRERGLFFALHQLFQFPTVRRLAEALRDQQAQTAEPSTTQPFSLISAADRELLPAQVVDAYPLSRLQAGMIYHRELHPDAAIYHDVMSFHVKAPFRIELLQQAIEQLCARHPALRTSFDLSHYSQPLQLVHSSVALPLSVEDLRHLEPEAQQAAITHWIESDKVRGFDIAQAPLLRFHVHLRSEHTVQFTLCFHHAILDGWSDATMQMEIAQSYMFMLYGEAPPFAPPQTMYRDFIAMEQEAVSSAEARQFWLKKVEGAEPIVLPRPSKPESDADARRGVFRVEAPISPELSDQLHKLALSSAVPLKTVLLASHMAVLGRLSGASDILTCITSNGRPETADGDRVLGLFLNSTPFRLELGKGKWSDFIRNTFAGERELLPFRRYPLVEIQQLVGGQRLSETGFYFTHYHIYQKLQRFGELEVLGFENYEESSFTLLAMFGVDPFTNRVNLQLCCDQTQVSPQYAEQLACWYEEALTNLALKTDSDLDFQSTGSDVEWAKAERRVIAVPAVERRETRFAQPNSPLESELAALWREVLGIERVGRDDNFFELGGHSLFATQVVSRIREKYQVALPIRELMGAPTVAGLAKAVQTAIWATQAQQETSDNSGREELIL